MTEQTATSSFPPTQMLEKVSSAGVLKANLKFWPLFLLAILAGMYIAFGGVFSTLVATGATGVIPYGIIKLLQGIVFSLGLILVVVGGAELFTGNILMVIPLFQGKIHLIQLLRNWVIVYLGNFVGSILTALLMISARTYLVADGQYGKTLLTIADSKLHYTFLQSFSLGILCNILVCLAVWLCFSARNTTDKILSILFPISAFIAAGFEHSVANMYLIPVGIFLKHMDPGFSANFVLDVTSLKFGNFFLANLLPVTLGNIIGGGLFVGLFYFLIYGHVAQSNDTKQ